MDNNNNAVTDQFDSPEANPGKIAVIGGGNIGEALVAGLVKAGVDPNSIFVTNRRSERSAELAERYGVVTGSDNVEAVSGASLCFLCVKPAQVIDVIGEISETLTHHDEQTALVSMAAGVTLAAMESAVSAAGTPLVRVMPNTPMLVGKGVHVVACGRYVDDETRQRVLRLLAVTGKVVEIPEKLIDAATAVSGAGPAYFFLFTEALIDAGVALGLTRDVAEELAAATVWGSGEMLMGDDSAAALRYAVTSPGGSTFRGIRELEESGVRGAIFRATEAVAERSAGLGG
ncbi:pyrroline-5-carboxylate reductase [Corynebacterium liangguodongii]|uniref:Pyrroline-5-carboxylate reductase n=1 Tax=Corynebacterium liangguodongii TaxID=2079535 RepID=A0A2S0WGY4_9CORY|nr:pyrroline-5-carboxylate reductase [Corynebacterium liangguodongii]AWB84986.1 pyrroline-5-carboxylate reductase [Corynebacterium liangguodongii]PWC00694.1 pyrroline-5-carboxylate reductase [Corynebacterium liangguodongii]